MHSVAAHNSVFAVENLFAVLSRMNLGEKSPYARSFRARLFKWCWMLSLVNGALVQTQVWLFSGVVLAPAFVAKLALSLPILAGLFLAPRFRFRGSLAGAYIYLCFSLLISFAVGGYQAQSSLAALGGAFLTNYFFLLLCPLCLLSAPLVDLKRLFRTLFTISFPLSLLGITQYLAASPILPTESTDGRLAVASWDFYGSVRAFSLFLSGLDFACFLALMMPFLVVCFATKRVVKSRLLSGLGICITGIATYATLTRNAYLFVPLSASAALIFLRNRPIGRTTWFFLPIIAAAIAIAAIIVVPITLTELPNGLLADQSLVERLVHWQVAVDTWTSHGWATFLFGNGEAQRAANEGYIVDNTFLNFAVQSGLVGLVACVVFIQTIWMSLREIINRKPSPFVIAICAFFLRGRWQAHST